MARAAAGSVDPMADERTRLEDQLRACLAELEESPDDPEARGRLLAAVLRYALLVRPRLFVDGIAPDDAPVV